MRAVRDDEIRQMLEARNERRVRRGQEPLDVEAELARLSRPAIDPALAAEVRQLVQARNARRVRRGEEPLDVEAEVQRALDELPAEFRVAVVLSDVEELSYKEIADAMGCPIGTVMSRLHRGRRGLQKLLADYARERGFVRAGAGEEASSK